MVIGVLRTHVVTHLEILYTPHTEVLASSAARSPSMNNSAASLMSGIPDLMVLQLLASREMYGYELARAIRVLTADAVAIGESVCCIRRCICSRRAAC